MFPSNQNRLFLVATSKATVTEASTAGALEFKSQGDQFYLLYKSPKGVIRSQVFNKSSLTYYKGISPDMQELKLKKAEITLNGDLVVGKDYVLSLDFKQALSLDYGSTYNKHGVVRVFAGMGVKEFWAKMAVSLFENFLRELNPLVKFKLKVGGESTSYVDVTPALVKTLKTGTVSADYVGIVVQEVAQPWELGLTNNQGVNFDVTAVPFEFGDTPWGSIAWGTDGAVSNGQTIADMESFFLGERGVQAQPYNYPLNVKVKTLADPTASYYVLEIRAYIEGTTVDAAGKQEQEITIACATKTDMNNILTSFRSATGVTAGQLTAF